MMIAKYWELSEEHLGVVKEIQEIYRVGWK